MKKKSQLTTTKLSSWELAIIQEALSSYSPPGLTDLAKGQYRALIKTLECAIDVSLTTYNPQGK